MDFAIDRLSEEKREIWHMVHDANMELRDVAATLGIAEGTVKSRLYYARKQIKGELQQFE